MATIAKYHPTPSSRRHLVTLNFLEDEVQRIAAHLGIDVGTPRVMIRMHGNGNTASFSLIPDPKGLKIYRDARANAEAVYSVAPTDSMLPKITAMSSFGASQCELDFSAPGIVRIPMPSERRKLIVRGSAANRESTALVPVAGVQPGGGALVVKASAMVVQTTEVLVGDVICDVPFSEALALVARHARRS